MSENTLYDAHVVEPNPVYTSGQLAETYIYTASWC